MPDPDVTQNEPAKPERSAELKARVTAIERDLSDARKELERREGAIVELQRELTEARSAGDALRSALVDREAALEQMRSEVSARDRTIEHLRAELGRRDTAPARARTRGSIVAMRARHRLHFSAGGEAVSVDAGREFRASIADLEDDRLVEGADFEVIG